ncbi:MAG: hypothetical protein ABJD11_18210, partial [Gemmatimonadota bacterium]
RARSDYGSGPPWTLFRTLPSVSPHRVVWADLAPRLGAAALTGESARDAVALNSCYLITPAQASEAHALAAWLNSTWIGAAARSVADPARGGFARFNARAVGGVPLPDAVLEDAELIRLGRAGAQGESVQAELDAHCARLLGLSAAACSTLASLVRGASSDRR